MTDHTFKPGHAVTFTTPGRYPRHREGKIKSIDGSFAVVECSDKEVRARIGTLKAA